MRTSTLHLYFDKRAIAWVKSLIHRSRYALTAWHANTHLPQIVGVGRGWETTGNATLHLITTEFMRILTAHYTYTFLRGISHCIVRILKMVDLTVNSPLF